MKEYLAYEQDASRYELIIRIVYTGFINFILYAYSLISGICFALQWLGILFFGRRSETLTNVLIGRNEFFIQVIPYIFLLTDERSGVMPQELKVFLNNKEYLIFEKDASRVELIVRIFYSIIIGIVVAIFSFLATIVLALQWICILFTKRRSDGLNDFIRSYANYLIQILSYVYLVTDDRPNVFPEEVNISLKLSDQIESSTSEDIVRTSPPLSKTIKDKHVAIGFILIFLYYIVYYVFLVMIYMISMNSGYYYY